MRYSVVPEMIAMVNRVLFRIWLPTLSIFCGIAGQATAVDVNLTWDAQSGADYYIVYWRSSHDHEFTNESAHISTKNLSLSLTDSSTGEAYVYGVRAFNTNANASDFSELVRTTHIPAIIQGTTDHYSISIVLPENGAVITEDEPAEFSANGFVNDEWMESCDISWESSLSGFMGSGADLTATLGPGVHTITATLTADTHTNVSDSILVTVSPWNTPPVIMIDEPSFLEAASGCKIFLFQATAIDEQDGDISQNITWLSDLDGELGKGSSLDVTLTDGYHRISARVEDSLGETATVVFGVDASRQWPITLTVTSARATYFNIVILSWTGANSDVVIYKDNTKIGTGDPEGTRRVWASQDGEYKVCESDGERCSDTVVPDP